MPLTNEEKALKAILDAVSDIRVDMGYLGFYLNQAIGPDKDRFIEMLKHAGLYAPAKEDEEMIEENMQSDASWNDILLMMLQDHNSVTKREAVDCLAEIMESGGIDWYPDGEAGALAHRIVFTFADENKTVVWQGRDEGIFISQLYNELSEENAFPYSTLDADDFEFSKAANGWQLVADASLYDVVAALEKDMGESSLVLPWENIAQQIADEELDGFLENHYPDAEEEGSDEREKAELVFTLYSRITDGSFQLPDELGDFAYDYGDGYMPAYSGAGRFNSFLGDLEDNHNWGIVYDECCGSCSRGSVEDIHAQEGKEDAPVFITWGQNSEGTWGTSGWVSHMAYHPDEEESTVVKAVAEKHGLEVKFGMDGQNKPDGFLYISLGA